MSKKIVYVVGGLINSDGMSQVLSQKINYLSEHTDWEFYMILTEKAGVPWIYNISSKVKFINFDINFDELNTMPFLKKIYYYWQKQHKYRRLFERYLMSVKPNITISTMRREINFINYIHDGSKKIGELHFNKSIYRNFHKSYLPHFANSFIEKKWQDSLMKEIRKLDAFVVLSAEDKKSWGNLNNIHVIYNPIKHYPKESSTCINKRIIAVGRYTEQKGFDMLIDAWVKVQKEHSDWTLNIYGDGDYQSYQELANSKHVGNTLKCNPAVKNIYEKYLESSMFVLSSRYEGFCLVLLEAMSCGLPAVSFDCHCGPKEVIQNDFNGYLVNERDINNLAKKICYLIENNEKRIAMGNNAKIFVTRFKEDEIMKNWIDLFNNII